jgi:hypothetical protein
VEFGQTANIDITVVDVGVGGSETLLNNGVGIDVCPGGVGCQTIQGSVVINAGKTVVSSTLYVDGSQIETAASWGSKEVVSDIIDKVEINCVLGIESQTKDDGLNSDFGDGNGGSKVSIPEVNIALSNGGISTVHSPNPLGDLTMSVSKGTGTEFGEDGWIEGGIITCVRIRRISNGDGNILVERDVFNESDDVSSGLLIEFLVRPCGIGSGQLSGPSIVLSEEDGVNGSESRVLISSNITKKVELIEGVDMGIIGDGQIIGIQGRKFQPVEHRSGK